MFYGARWYDSSLRRFTSPDTVIPVQSQGTQAWDRYAYANNSPIRFNDPSGHDVGCPGFNGGRCSSYNTLSQETLAKLNYTITPVVNYIYNEIEKNSSSKAVSEINALNTEAEKSNPIVNKTSAYSEWALKVGPGQEWDHKAAIQDMEKQAGRNKDFQAAGTRSYKYDTWSNIHYGFVGKAAGFSESELLDGAGLAQGGVDILKGKKIDLGPLFSGWRGFDEPQDNETIQIGIDLWSQYRYDLLPGDIIWLLENSDNVVTQ